LEEVTSKAKEVTRNPNIYELVSPLDVWNMINYLPTSSFE